MREEETWWGFCFVLNTGKGGKMETENKINERMKRVEQASELEVLMSYHGVAARLDRLPVGGWHRKMVFLFACCIFCDGLDTFVGGGIIAHLLAEGWSTVELNGAFSSLTMFGYFFGCLMSGWLGDHLGRRRGLMINLSIFAIATFAGGFAPNMETLCALRFVMGIGLGAAIPGSYGIQGEFIPPSKRAKYSSLVGAFGNFAPPLGSFLVLVLVPLVGWRPIFWGIGILTGFVVFLVWKLMPESPRWLAQQGRTQEADAIVTKVEKTFSDKGIKLEELNYEKIKEEFTNDTGVQLPYSALFSKKPLRRLIAISSALLAMNIIVPTITNWTPTIFVLQGLSATASVGISFVMLIGAPVGIFILSFLADKHPRKGGLVVTLLLVAICGYLWSLVPVDQVYLIMAIGFVLCCLAYYYALLGCSVYIGEIFPTELRARGSGLANAIGRISAILSPIWITYLLNTSGAGSVYAVNGIILVVLAIMIGVFGVETRNTTLEEVNDEIVQEALKKIESKK